MFYDVKASENENSFEVNPMAVLGSVMFFFNPSY